MTTLIGLITRYTSKKSFGAKVYDACRIRTQRQHDRFHDKVRVLISHEPKSTVGSWSSWGWSGSNAESKGGELEMHPAVARRLARALLAAADAADGFTDQFEADVQEVRLNDANRKRMADGSSESLQLLAQELARERREREAERKRCPSTAESGDDEDDAYDEDEDEDEDEEWDDDAPPVEAKDVVLIIEPPPLS